MFSVWEEDVKVNFIGSSLISTEQMENKNNKNIYSRNSIYKQNTKK